MSDINSFRPYRFTASKRSVYIEQLEWGTRWLIAKTPIDAAFIAEACNTYFKHLHKIEQLSVRNADLEREVAALRQQVLHLQLRGEE